MDHSRAEYRFSTITKPWFWFSVVVAVFAIFWFYYAWSAVTYPYALDSNENFVLNQVKLFLAHPELRTIYPPLAQPPYFTSPYPPLFVLLSATIIGFFHLPLDHTVGRLLSIVSLLAISGLVYAVLRRSAGRALALAGALAFMSVSNVMGWAVLDRVDFLGLAFTMLGAFLITRPSRFSLWLSVPCFVLAFYTKTTFLAGPLAATLYLWWQGQRRTALAYALAFVVPVVALFWWCNQLTGGQFFVHLITVNTGQRFYFSNLSLGLAPLATWPAAFLLFPTALFLEARFRGRVELSPRSSLAFFMLYLAGSLVSLVAYARAGAGPNYWFEFQLACLMVGLLAWSSLKGQVLAPLLRWFTENRSVLVLFALLSFTIVQGIAIQNLNTVVDAAWQRLPDYTTVVERLIHLGSADFFEEDMQFAPFVRAQSWLLGSRTYPHLVRRGLWDQSLFVTKFNRREFKLVLLSMARGTIDHRRYNVRDGNAPLTNEMIAAIRSNYELREVLGDQLLYYPKP